MRIGSCIAMSLASMAMVEAIELDRATAFPLRNSANPDAAAFIRVGGDSCGWWGTRWQYGWRGYGWYLCWEWPKPAPVVVDPDAIPERPLATEPCEHSWRDAEGRLHRRRTC